MMKRSFGLKAVALAVAIMGFAVAQSAAQCTHNPATGRNQSNAGPGPWTDSLHLRQVPKQDDHQCARQAFKLLDRAPITPETVFEFTAPATGIYMRFDCVHQHASVVIRTRRCGSSQTAATQSARKLAAAMTSAEVTLRIQTATVSLTAGTTYYISHSRAWLTRRPPVEVGGVEHRIRSAPPGKRPVRRRGSDVEPSVLPRSVNLALCNDEGLDNTAISGCVRWPWSRRLLHFHPGNHGHLFTFLAAGVDSGIAYYTGSCGSLTSKWLASMRHVGARPATLEPHERHGIHVYGRRAMTPQ
jgi:hypothetical protein